MRKVVLLDCDGVLADFRTRALDVVEEVTGVRRLAANSDWEMFGHLNEEQNTAVWDIIRSPGWCSSLEPYPEALEAVRELQELANVYILTAPVRGSQTWSYERTEWVSEHFGIGFHNVILAQAKYLVQGDVFVDDKPGHVREWMANFGGNGFVWSNWLEPTNSDLETYRTQDWGDIIKLVR